MHSNDGLFLPVLLPGTTVLHGTTRLQQTSPIEWHKHDLQGRNLIMGTSVFQAFSDVYRILVTRHFHWPLGPESLRKSSSEHHAFTAYIAGSMDLPAIARNLKSSSYKASRHYFNTEQFWHMHASSSS